MFDRCFIRGIVGWCGVETHESNVKTELPRPLGLDSRLLGCYTRMRFTLCCVDWGPVATRDENFMLNLCVEPGKKLNSAAKRETNFSATEAHTIPRP